MNLINLEFDAMTENMLVLISLRFLMLIRSIYFKNHDWVSECYRHRLSSISNGHLFISLKNKIFDRLITRACPSPYGQVRRRKSLISPFIRSRPSREFERRRALTIVYEYKNFLDKELLKKTKNQLTWVHRCSRRRRSACCCSSR